MKHYTFMVLLGNRPQGTVTVTASNYPNAITFARYYAFLHLKCNPTEIVTDLIDQRVSA